MVSMALDPIRSVLTRRSILLTLPLALSAKQPIRVELFLATQCPISNRYVPELNRLAAAYPAIQFEAWFPEPELTADKLKQWVDSFAVKFQTNLDPGGRRAAKSGATLTPEAVVYKDGTLFYRGRIDDRYVGWGKSRPAPTQHDVAETLDLLIAGKSPATRYTKSWGCYIEAKP